ncbi:MAG: hypothetical protein M3R69_04550 [Acidobacteriota bacterium]|nr:hypothetical protein [Acidobacteriota bacterium]
MFPAIGASIPFLVSENGIIGVQRELNVLIIPSSFPTTRESWPANYVYEYARSLALEEYAGLFHGHENMGGAENVGAYLNGCATKVEEGSLITAVAPEPYCALLNLRTGRREELSLMNVWLPKSRNEQVRR